jgi:hypothetical protein
MLPSAQLSNTVDKFFQRETLCVFFKIIKDWSPLAQLVHPYYVTACGYVVMIQIKNLSQNVAKDAKFYYKINKYNPPQN